MPLNPPKPAAAATAGRRHVEGKPNLPVFAGALGHELESHALLRAEGFFYYVVAMKITVAELNALAQKSGKPQVAHSFYVMAKATDQIGTGMRSDAGDTYDHFIQSDPLVVDKPTTHFKRADAAHLCNLGLALSLADACRASAFTRDGYERLKVHAGATKWLPQQVNVGVDRKIDFMHAQLAPDILDDGGLVFTRERVATYREEAVKAVTTYRDEKLAKGLLGLAACADCYLRMYASDDFEGRIFRRVYPEVIGLCEASAFFRGQSHLFYR
jgi:hypothetical protein